VADLLNETLIRLDRVPRVFILRMHKVPIVDTTGIRALKAFKSKCDQKGILFLISGVSEDLREKFQNSSLEETIGEEHIFSGIDAALAYAKGYEGNAEHRPLEPVGK
jgi:SulP family sulfate permease